MNLNRLYCSFRMMTFSSDKTRSNWLKKKKVFYDMGENVSLNLKVLPLYPKLICFHNNIKVATGVTFITHDVIHLVLKRSRKSEFQFEENIGCIEIMDNVFIGAKSVLLPNIRIGPNAIIAAGAVVSKDVPPGEIWGGVPAKRIGSFDDYYEKCISLTKEKNDFSWHGDNVIGEDRVIQEWDYFNKKRNMSGRK